MKRPAGAAVMMSVIHLVLVCFGAKESTQTGKKMERMTWLNPDKNLANIYHD